MAMKIWVPGGLLPPNAPSDLESVRACGVMPQGPSRQKITDLASVAICLCCTLAGCSTPAIRDRIVEVDKPVAVQPVRPADVPAVPAPLGPRPSSLSAAADVLLSRWCAAVAYMLKADPLLRVSAGMKQEPLAKYPECEGR